MLGAILLIVLVLMLLGTLPTWGHSRSWGYGPSGGLGVVYSSSLCCSSWAYFDVDLSVSTRRHAGRH